MPDLHRFGGWGIQARFDDLDGIAFMGLDDEGSVIE